MSPSLTVEEFEYLSMTDQKLRARIREYLRIRQKQEGWSERDFNLLARSTFIRMKEEKERRVAELN